MAERRGLLGGARPLSSVQQYALKTLMVADSKERAEDAVERFRLALVTHSPNRAPDLYGWDRSDMTEEEFDRVTADPTAAVEYDLEIIPPEEAERIMAEMLANPVGAVEG